uniref:Uncharacterized protein n=1 Tax=Babesia bovis TaxID=5865 RepID=S6B9N4_BABBO|nr:hypothetical protein [Babesia bovis]
MFDQGGTPLSYTAFKISQGLPIKWSQNDHRFISAVEQYFHKYSMITSVALAFPQSESSSFDVFDFFQSAGFKLDNLCLGALCTSEFIRGVLLPYKLGICSTGNIDGLTILFSLSFDEGLYLSLPKHAISTLGLSNTSYVNIHKDGIISLHMDVLSSGYLKEDSKLCNRTVTALNRISSCSAMISQQSLTQSDNTGLYTELLKLGCDVLPLKPCASSKIYYPAADTLLNPVDISIMGEYGLKHGVISENALDSGSAVETGVHVLNDFKRRKMTSVKTSQSSNDTMDRVLNYRGALFKAYRTLGDVNNHGMDTVCNVLSELEKHDFSSVTEHVVTRLRQEIDTLIFRGLHSPGITNGNVNEDSLLDNAPRKAFIISTLSNIAMSSEHLYAIFNYAWERLVTSVDMFIISVTSQRSCKENINCKFMETAPGSDHLYLICSKTSESEATVFLISSN